MYRIPCVYQSPQSFLPVLARWWASLFKNENKRRRIETRSVRPLFFLRRVRRRRSQFFHRNWTVYNTSYVKKSSQHLILCRPNLFLCYRNYYCVKRERTCHSARLSPSPKSRKTAKNSSERKWQRQTRQTGTRLRKVCTKDSLFFSCLLFLLLPIEHGRKSVHVFFLRLIQYLYKVYVLFRLGASELMLIWTRDPFKVDESVSNWSEESFTKILYRQPTISVGASRWKLIAEKVASAIKPSVVRNQF